MNNILLKNFDKLLRERPTVIDTDEGKKIVYEQPLLFLLQQSIKSSGGDGQSKGSTKSYNLLNLDALELQQDIQVACMQYFTEHKIRVDYDFYTGVSHFITQCMGHNDEEYAIQMTGYWIAKIEEMLFKQPKAELDLECPVCKQKWFNDDELRKRTLEYDAANVKCRYCNLQWNALEFAEYYGRHSADSVSINAVEE